MGRGKLLSPKTKTEVPKGGLKETPPLPKVLTPPLQAKFLFLSLVSHKKWQKCNRSEELPVPQKSLHDYSEVSATVSYWAFSQVNGRRVALSIGLEAESIPKTVPSFRFYSVGFQQNGGMFPRRNEVQNCTCDPPLKLSLSFSPLMFQEEAGSGRQRPENFSEWGNFGGGRSCLFLHFFVQFIKK